MNESQDQGSKSIFKDPQTFIAIGVTIISLCALIVSLMQTSIIRHIQKKARSVK